MKSSIPSRPARWLARIVLTAVLSLVLAFLKVWIVQSVISVIYTVNGIMFSIALSQLASFSFSDIENDDFVRQHREQLNHLRLSFIVMFALSTTAFLLSGSDLLRDWLNPVCFSILIFNLAYNVINFCNLATAKDEIDDKIRKARKDS